MNRACVALGLIAAIASTGISSSRAGELYLAGANSGVNSDYAFAGVLIPLPGAQLGKGLAARVWGDHLDYSYLSNGRRIDASGFGGALAGVYQFSGDWGWSNLSAGMTFRNTLLSASDPSNREAGAHAYFNGQADGGFNLNASWRIRGLASYTPQSHDYFVQAGIDRVVFEGLRLGVGPIFQGGRNYREVSGGITAYFQIRNGLELAPTIGVSHSSSGDTGAYGGVTLVLVTQ